MTTQTYYDVLEVARHASDEVIRAAYMRLAQKWHPDKHSGHAKAEAEERMKQITVAYRHLYDAELRKVHDRAIDAAGVAAEQQRREAQAEEVAPVRSKTEPKAQSVGASVDKGNSPFAWFGAIILGVVIWLGYYASINVGFWKSLEVWWKHSFLSAPGVFPLVFMILIGIGGFWRKNKSK